MVSQNDVAKAAGVSPATASLALNNHPRVSPRTRLRVQKAARRLGYVPNHAARQLIRSRFGKSAGTEVRQVGMILCHHVSDHAPLMDTYMAFLQGAEQAIAARDGLLIFLRQSQAGFEARLRYLSQSAMVDAWILFGAVTEEHAAFVESLGRPWVVLGDHACVRLVHEVNMDFRLMGRLAVRHLVELGHREIGFLGSNMRFVYQREILAGFREGIREAGLALQPEWVVTREGEADPLPLAEAAMARTLALTPRPTALVCGEAGESAALLGECGRQGVRVPGEWSLMFCELNDSRPVAEGIARVEASASEAGRAAVSLLADVAAATDLPARKVRVAPRVVLGWSADAPHKHVS